MGNMDITIDVKENFLKIRELILKPKHFFKKAVKEKNWKNAFSTLIVASLVSNIIAFVFISLFPGQFLVDLGFATPPSIALNLAIGLVVSLGMSFFWAAVARLWLKLFKIHSTFSQAYKALIYSSIPNRLIGWLPYIGFISLLYGVYLFNIALQEEYKINNKRSITIAVSSMLLAVFGLSLVVIFLTPLINNT